MVELIAFLRARTEEDRQASGKIHHGECDSVPGTWDDGGTCDCRWPRRVLAEVEAKRGIIDNAEAARDQFTHDGGRDPELQIAAEAWELALRVLGTAYAGHPDYREDWRPGSTPAWVVDR